jgi:hypothetical protein
MKLDFAISVDDLGQYQESGFESLKELRSRDITKKEFFEQVDLRDFEAMGYNVEEATDTKCKYYEIKNGFPITGLSFGSGKKADAIFTADGVVPVFISKRTVDISVLMRDKSLWLLEPANSAISMLFSPKEDVRFSTSRFACFDGQDGSMRIQSIVDGNPVGAIQIKSGEVTASYFESGFEKKKKSLIDLAIKLCGDFSLNSEAIENKRNRMDCSLSM